MRLFHPLQKAFDALLAEVRNVGNVVSSAISSLCEDVQEQTEAIRETYKGQKAQEAPEQEIRAHVDLHME